MMKPNADAFFCSVENVCALFFKTQPRLEHSLTRNRPNMMNRHDERSVEHHQHKHHQCQSRISFYIDVGAESIRHPLLRMFISIDFQICSTTSLSLNREASAPSPPRHRSTPVERTFCPQLRTLSGTWSPRQPTYTPSVCLNSSPGLLHL